MSKFDIGIFLNKTFDFLREECTILVLEEDKFQRVIEGAVKMLEERDGVREEDDDRTIEGSPSPKKKRKNDDDESPSPKKKIKREVQNKSRPFYTPEEDRSILAFASFHKNSPLSQVQRWKQAQRENLCPGRTWQGMHHRYIALRDGSSGKRFTASAIRKIVRWSILWDHYKCKGNKWSGFTEQNPEEIFEDESKVERFFSKLQHDDMEALREKGSKPVHAERFWDFRRYR